jgi:hypothetical protein
LEHHVERFLAHDHSAFRDGDPIGGTFVGDVNHASFAALIDVREGWWCHSRRRLGFPRCRRRPRFRALFRQRRAPAACFGATRNWFLPQCH